MEDPHQVQFRHWAYLQKCLKYERLCVAHDADENKRLLEHLSSLHNEYYRQQLLIRQTISYSTKRKVMIEDVRGFLGDHYVYVEHFVRLIRNNPAAFNLIVECCDTNLPFLDMLVESFTYSFFEDLMNPEGTELELLKVLKTMMQIEFKRHPSTSDIFNESVSSVLGKILTIYIKRRAQRKYLRLVLKRPLMKIVHGEEADLRLDPKIIYQSLSMRRESMIKMDSPVQILPSQDSATKRVEQEQSCFDLYDTDYYMKDSNVKEQIAFVSERLIEHSKMILNHLYSNINTMPYGVRWICKCICVLTAERNPGKNSEAEQRLMLGTFLFTKWWLVAINSANTNGLVSDTLICSETRGNLSLISNPQFELINKFILEEIPNMRQFLFKVIDIEDFVDNKRPNRNANVVMNLGTKQAKQKYSEKGDTMAYFYTQAINRSYPEVVLEPTKSLDLSGFEEFRFQGIALTVTDVRVLVDLVISNEHLFLLKNLDSLIRSAKKIKKATLEDNLFASKGPSQTESYYLLFAEIVLPNFEPITKPTVIKMNEDYHKRLILSRVKNAVCDLLFGLDSFAMFFERTKNCSLLEIIDFVIKFSYLFESNRRRERVPLKLLAQFLDTNLKSLPSNFTEGNFAHLYKAILRDYEQRFAAKCRVAESEKQLLLLAVNIMEKHLADSRQEVKLQQSTRNLQELMRIIQQVRVPVCIAMHKLKNKQTIEILPQDECMHVRTRSMTLIPKIIKRNPNRSVCNEVSLGKTPGHVVTIDEFAEQFSNMDQVARCTQSSEEAEYVAMSFSKYLNQVRLEVVRIKGSSCKEEEVQAIVEEIESYIMQSMYRGKAKVSL